jgi:pimeloyl-ACP methyl ester carboxylesterase
VAALHSGPRWPGLLARTPTVPRECRVEDGWDYRSGRLDRITASTLVLSGSETPADLKAATDRAAAAIAGARVQVLEGHAHLAHRTDPALVAAAIQRFVLG